MPRSFRTRTLSTSLRSKSTALKSPSSKSKTLNGSRKLVIEFPRDPNYQFIDGFAMFKSWIRSKERIKRKMHGWNTRDEEKGGRRTREEEVVGWCMLDAFYLSPFKVGTRVRLFGRFRFYSVRFGTVTVAPLVGISVVGIRFPHHVGDSEGARERRVGNRRKGSAEGSIVGQPSRRVVARDRRLAR